MKTSRLAIVACVSLLFVGSAAAQDNDWRTIEFETTEVTEADVALSPDGQWLIFTMVGHLFRLPVEGGTAEQLTFGPYYDSEPVISPEGSRVVFISDRGGPSTADGSVWGEGNVFVLELETGETRQLTHEPWAGWPVWTPDGRAIVYLSLGGTVPEVAWPRVLARVRRIPLNGDEPEILTAEPRAFGSVFYLRDGRLGWTVIEGGSGSAFTTLIEIMSPQGEVATVRSLKGYADRMIPSPAGNGLYFRRVPRWTTPRQMLVSRLWRRAGVLFLPLPEGGERRILPPADPDGVWNWTTRFAVAADNESLYLGDAGRLWRISVSDGERDPIPFSARVRREVADPTSPAKPQLVGATSRSPRVVLAPRLSPDGRSLVFGAAGFLWRQGLEGGTARRLFEGSGFEDWPAFSPDGQQLAFVHGEHGTYGIRVLDFESGETRTVAAGSWQPSWSPDGHRLVFGDRPVVTGNWRVITSDLRGGEEVVATIGLWSPRPHFSPDGRSVHYSATGTLYRWSLEGQARPESVIQLARRPNEAVVSPDGESLAFRRNTEIWLAPMPNGSVKEEDARQLTSEGGETFAFAPDSSALIYAVGNRVWRHPLKGGEREEIPVRLELRRPVPPPLLLQGVRVLDFESRGFGSETSFFIEGGRIQWIGSVAGHDIPDDTVVIDASGRFAIPGLFDMHVHTYGHAVLGNQLAFLAYGITSIRVPGTALSWLNLMADRSEMTAEPLPRYFFSGEIFWGAYEAPISDNLVLVEDEDDARTYVRRFKERGAHFIKVYSHLPWALKRVVADEARRLGLPVAGHGMQAEEVIRSVILGFAVLEHWAPLHDDVLRLLAAAGTRWVPTLSVTGGTRLMLAVEPEQAEDTKFRAFVSGENLQAEIGIWRHWGLWDALVWWVAGAGTLGVCAGLVLGLLRWHRSAYSRVSPYRGAMYWHRVTGLGLGLVVLAWILSGGATIATEGLRAEWLEGLAMVRAGDDRGVRLHAGTDNGGLWGPTLHWELEHLVQAGIKPIEVLRIATQQAAEALGAEDDLGTLEPGKLADIVLLDENPLDDIRNTQSIWRVMKGGWVFDPDELRPPAASAEN